MDSVINYNKTIDNLSNWVIEETIFNSEFQAKFEVILGLGNSYCGLRSVTEENYSNRHYGLFIGGTFNCPEGNEVPELPNGADILNFEFYINDKRFSLDKGTIENYSRYLNLKTGELIREFIWTSPENEKIKFKFQRFTSFANCHAICQKITLISINGNFKVTIVSGIDGQTTNSGTQHFIDYDSHFWEKKYLQYIFQTTESKINFFYNRTYNFYQQDVLLTDVKNVLLSVYGYDRRKLYQEFYLSLTKDVPLIIESMGTIHTSRDFDFNLNDNYEETLVKTKNELKAISKNRYGTLFDQHLEAFTNHYAIANIELESNNNFDELAVRFALYNLWKFTPIYDKRLNIEAKGFMGEEYKGHTFWDTEIYLLPYFIYTNPQYARQLLEHRYFVFPSAFIKAKELDYEGAMWPWETCWVNDGETCPTWGEVDWETGKRMKVWPAYNELHISADIMWAILLYYKQTNDEQFMNDYGYEMLFATAWFWTSKVEKNNKTGKYEILQVTGPNEYKENINNNAFTNYLVHHMLTEVLQFTKIANQSVIAKLQSKYNYQKILSKITDAINNFYLPEPNDQGIIPENDSFLSLQDIPKLDYYKAHKGTIWSDYTSNQLNKYQVCKQADIAVLFYVAPELFSSQTIIDNWKYYEHRTLHNSSLSYSMYSVTAMQAQEPELAYQFFQKACEVDLGPNMYSSNNGIHAAAIGGIIKCVLEGFGGVKMTNKFIINPKLPNSWKKLAFTMMYHDNELKVAVTQNEIAVNIEKLVTDKINIWICNEEQVFTKDKLSYVRKLVR